MKMITKKKKRLRWKKEEKEKKQKDRTAVWQKDYYYIYNGDIGDDVATVYVMMMFMKLISDDFTNDICRLLKALVFFFYFPLFLFK